MVAPKKVKEDERDVTFAEGGDTPMFKKQAAGPDKPGNTGKDQSSAPGAKFAQGGSNKMFGFSGSQPAKSGQTGAR
jgi:hypothetical protein